MPGLKINILRIVGKVINLVVVVLFIVDLFVNLGGEGALIPPVLITVGIALLIGQFFIEKDFLDDYRLIFIIIIYGATLIPAIFTLSDRTSGFTLAIVSVYIAAVLTTPFYQQYSLSIYKNEKTMFIVFFAFIEIAATLVIVVIEYMIWIVIIAQILMAIALVMIFVVEAILKKKKLLNYI
mgnify:CR=1 FL=1